MTCETPCSRISASSRPGSLRSPQAKRTRLNGSGPISSSSREGRSLASKAMKSSASSSSVLTTQLPMQPWAPVTRKQSLAIADSREL